MFYEYILEEDVCICGVDFSENPEHREEIQEKLKILNELIEEKGIVEEDRLSYVIEDVLSLY